LEFEAVLKPFADGKPENNIVKMQRQWLLHITAYYLLFYRTNSLILSNEGNQKSIETKKYGCYINRYL
jgi:hypothetical protein